MTAMLAISSGATTVAIYSVTWLAFGVLSGWIASRVPATTLGHDGPVTRIRRWERSGRFYVRSLHIRAWKDHLPEAGATFRGGMSKRHLPGTAPAALTTFAIETRRAELVHWAQIGFAPTFALWNPAWVAGVMVAFASVVHLPFVAVQRFNRLRVERTLAGSRRVDEHEGVEDDPFVEQPPDAVHADDQDAAEALDDDMLGDEELCTDGLRAHDLDLVDSIADRADREVPDFDSRRPRSDHTAQQLATGRGIDTDMIGIELPADGPVTAEEAAIHLEDEAGHAI